MKEGTVVESHWGCLDRLVRAGFSEEVSLGLRYKQERTNKVLGDLQHTEHIKCKCPEVDWKPSLFSGPGSSCISHLSVGGPTLSQMGGFASPQNHSELFFPESFPVGFSF